jgi:NAD(P)-dependent dehydrogenase (short-subunit alcohol dehydrogenase family)
VTEHRLAVVTGVSHGIGAAVTDMLLAEGWGVVGLSRTPPEPRPGLYWFFCDVGIPDVVTDILALAGIDTLDALVHCAGVRGPFGPFLENDPEAWAQTIQTNLMGTASVLRACLPPLQRSGDARALLFSGGGTISAQYDDWASIDQTTIDSVVASTMGMRDRHKIQCVRSSPRIRRYAAV